MTGEKIHGRIVSDITVRAPALLRNIPGIQVRRTHHALGRFGRLPVISLQEGTHIVTVAAVPFRPAVPCGETADLVQAAGIPGFRDQLYIRKDRVHGKPLDQGRILHRGTVLISPQNAGEIKTKTVDLIIDRPEMQTFHDHLLNDGMIAVHRVAAARKVIIVPFRRKHVIDIVVEALEGNKLSVLIPLRRMVEYNVKDHLDPCLMKRMDQLPQFSSLPVVFLGGSVSRIRGKVADRVVSPVFKEHLSLKLPGVHHLVKLKDWHQFHRGDAEPFEVGNLLPDSQKGSRRGHAGIPAEGKAPDMEFIDDQVLHGNLPVGMVRPFIGSSHNPGMVGLISGLRLPPVPVGGHRFCVDIQQHMSFVKKLAFFRTVGTVHPVGILKTGNIESEDNHGPDIPDPVSVRKWNHRVGFLLAAVKKQQLHRSGAAGVQRKVDGTAVSHGGRTVQLAQSHTDRVAGNAVPRSSHIIHYTWEIIDIVVHRTFSVNSVLLSVYFFSITHVMPIH